LKFLLVPLEFFKAIGEKPHAIRIYWVKWLADHTDILSKPDFITLFHNEMVKEGKKVNLDTIKEAYDFGMPFFKDGFIFSETKQKRKRTTYDSQFSDFASKVISYLNNKSLSSFKLTKANVDLINARKNEGYSLSDFEKVIDKKVKQWMGTEQEKYIRPITLFQAKKFENYLNEPESNEPKYKKQSSINKLSNATSRAKELLNGLLSE
jgi:uncharacterized phage protein (TIGR02220 family)